MANETPTSSIELIGLQGQLEGVRSELVSTNNGLLGIGNLIRADSAQDQQRLLEERRDQQILSERQVRIGQEEELERKVSASFVEPVNKVEKTLNSTFNNISNALKFLFVGVVGGVFLKDLNKAIDLGKSTLTGVGNLLTNIFGAIGSGLGSIKDGFGSVITSIGGVVDNISKGILSLVSSPFQAIADTFKKLLGIDDKDKNPPPTNPPSTTPPLSSQPSADNSLSVPFLGSIEVPEPLQNTFTGISNFTSSALSGIQRGIQSLTPGTNISNFNFDDTMKGIENAFTSKFDLFSANQTTGTAPATPPSTSSPPNTTTSSTSAAQPAGPQALKVVPYDQSQVQNPPSQSRNLNPLEEPKPDVVYLQSGNQQASTTVSGGGGEYLTDVPLIPSANPDNFYTLYAQLNYNVVI